MTKTQAPFKIREKIANRRTLFSKSLFLFLTPAVLFISCQRSAEQPDFAIEDFNMLNNWQTDLTDKKINLDYQNAIDSGFIIPTARQIPEGVFEFVFKIKSLSKARTYYYKIYYQNESYKYPEDYGMELMNPLCEENFYGSWENVETGFKATPKITSRTPELIKDYFRIVGNPREEERYFGNVPSNKPITEEEISIMAQGIRLNKPWYEDVIRKAKNNNISVEEQIRLDAIWVIRENRMKNRINQRWKRNVRTGQYSFMLVVTTEEDLKKIPSSLKNISETWNGQFVNPYWYFNYGPGRQLKNTAIVLSPVRFSVSAHPDPGAGIYVNDSHLRANNYDWIDTCSRSDCGSNLSLFSNACFEQYFHFIHSSMQFKNIPVITKLHDSFFTRKMYEEYLKSYDDKNMVNASITNTDCPCRDVFADSSLNQIVLQSPPPAKNKYEKVNIGVMSRHGFTYGKFTAKIKFPELLNNDQMWNGLTNAFWLLNQSNEEWNRVRECRKKGFIPKNLSGENAERVLTTSYSEIDIEIRKASPVWPVTSYTPPHRRPEYKGDDWEDIIVTCTIWDLACEQPKKFTSGTQYAYHDNEKFLWHRWNPWYQALTTKYPVKDDSLNKRNYYYYQIEWKPDTIIWRIGPEKDQMKVIGYADATITTIPNNQMLMVITQEYHPSIWWPESPQLLEYIPFTETPIKGYVLSIEIE